MYNKMIKTSAYIYFIHVSKRIMTQFFPLLKSFHVTDGADSFKGDMCF